MRWGNKLGSSLEIVKGAVDAGVASPGILLGTLLARPHVTDAPLVPDVADLGAGATLAVLRAEEGGVRRVYSEAKRERTLRQKNNVH